jgi:hypothetical protein
VRPSRLGKARPIEPSRGLLTPIRMVLKLKIALFALVMILGIWLAFQPRDGMLYSSWKDLSRLPAYAVGVA